MEKFLSSQKLEKTQFIRILRLVMYRLKSLKTRWFEEIFRMSNESRNLLFSSSKMNDQELNELVDESKQN